jgi:hypothetical protein
MRSCLISVEADGGACGVYVLQRSDIDGMDAVSNTRTYAQARSRNTYTPQAPPSASTLSTLSTIKTYKLRM